MIIYGDDDDGNNNNNNNNIRLHFYRDHLPPYTGTVVYEQFICSLVRIYDVLYCFAVQRENRRVRALGARRCGSAEH
jgi:hypothetical protein